MLVTYSHFFSVVTAYPREREVSTTDMRESLSVPPVKLEPYTGCPACDQYLKYRWSLYHPPPPDAVLAADPDGIDNSYYWGYGPDVRNKRMAIVRPLPPSLTDCIPLELFEHILDFLRWETWDLYSCALVCRAWHHHSQRLLYGRVVIESRAGYDAVVQSSMGNGRSKQYLARTSILELGPCREFTTQKYLLPAPLVLRRTMHSVTCLRFRGSIQTPYHPSFALSFSSFPGLIHLKLNDFRLNSFTDLRVVICGLKNLRELALIGGTLVSRAGTTHPTVTAGFAPVEAPRLRKVTLHLEQNLFSKLGQWMTSTEICDSCTMLSLWVDNRQEEGPCAESILRKLCPSLASLSYRLCYADSWQHLGVLACCTQLSTVSLTVRVNPMDSWQGLVTAFHEILSHFSSPMVRTIDFRIHMHTPSGSASTSAHLDGDFWAIDLRLVHDLMKRPLFDSLRGANLIVWHDGPQARLTCDAVLTAEEMERRIRLIFKPWDKHQILTAEGYDEEIDEAPTGEVHDVPQVLRGRRGC